MHDDDFPAPLPPNGPSWRPPQRGGIFGSLGRLILLLIIGAMIVLPFTPMAGRIKRALGDLAEKARGTRLTNQEGTKHVEAPPPPLPDKFVPRKDVDVTTMYNGISINSKVETQSGNYASLEVDDPDAYKVNFSLSVKVPKPNQTVQELARLNPELPKMLPGLEALIAGGKVSGFYHKLYENKMATVEKDIARLSRLLDRHNMFDCETILELKEPKTSRKALLIQSEMDVVADGTDGDRAPTLDASLSSSDFYQPSTSYFWKKLTPAPNPLLARWQSRLEGATAELAKPGLSTERNRQLKNSVTQLKNEIADMKAHSTLIADGDPFIVLPLMFKPYGGVNDFAPQMGDLVVVIHGRQILPAICGDYGPAMKMGEASLFLAKQINAKATANRRGEDDLKVTYLVFPGTAKKPFGPPKLEEWRTACIQYLNELGGIGSGYEVHAWEDKYKKPDVVVAPDTIMQPVTPAAPNAAPPPVAGAPSLPAPLTPADKPVDGGPLASETVKKPEAPAPNKSPSKTNAKKKKTP